MSSIPSRLPVQSWLASLPSVSSFQTKASTFATYLLDQGKLLMHKAPAWNWKAALIGGVAMALLCLSSTIYFIFRSRANRSGKANLQSEVQNLKTEIEALKRANSEKTKTFETVNKDLKTTAEDLAKKVREQSATIAAKDAQLTEQMATAREQIQKQRAEAEQHYSTSMTREQKSHNETRDQLMAADREIKALKEENSSLKQKLEAAEQDSLS